MKPLPRKTEERSISALTNIINDHPTMDGTNIKKGDKDLSWDGFIRIFQSDDTASDKANYDDDIPVQIKGHVDNSGIKYKGKERIMAPVELDDLRNYYRKTGCLYFVIYMNEEGRDVEIFYSSLYPSKIKGYLEKANCKGNTGTISIPFLKLEKDNKELFLLCKQFSFEIRKQGSGLGQIVPRSIMGNDLLTVKKITLTSVGASSPFDMLKRINTGDAVFYGTIDDSGIQYPLQVSELTVSVRETIEEPLCIGEKEYYSSFEIERIVNNPDSKDFSINGIHAVYPSQNVKITFERGKSNIRYQFKTDILQLKRDAEFLLKLLEKGEITAFDTLISIGTMNPDQESIEILKAIVEVGQTLEDIGINILTSFVDLTDNDKNQINLLMNIKHGRAKLNTDQKQFVYYWHFQDKLWPIIVDLEKETVIGLIFNTSVVFSIGSPTGQTTDRLPPNAYIVPNFVRTEPEVLANLYAYDYESMFEQIDRSVYVEPTVGLLNELSLHLISAYDICADDMFLELAIEVLKRIGEKFPDGEDTLVNLCQIEVRKNGKLSSESIKELERMMQITKSYPKPENDEQADIEKTFSYCVSVLKKDLESANRIYSTLTDADKKGIDRFPIIYLHRKLAEEIEVHMESNKST